LAESYQNMDDEIDFESFLRVSPYLFVFLIWFFCLRICVFIAFLEEVVWTWRNCTHIFPRFRKRHWDLLNYPNLHLYYVKIEGVYVFCLSKLRGGVCNFPNK
jgi:hypothetical protein